MAITWASDRTKHIYWFIILPVSLSIVMYAIPMGTTNTGALYFAMMFMPWTSGTCCWISERHPTCMLTNASCCAASSLQDCQPPPSSTHCQARCDRGDAQLDRRYQQRVDELPLVCASSLLRRIWCS